VLAGFKINGRILELLPNLTLLRRECRGLLKESTNTVASDLGCGMKPAE
jgi:hypothetical protein